MTSSFLYILLPVFVTGLAESLRKQSLDECTVGNQENETVLQDVVHAT